MIPDLKSKVVLVTGASTGIGAATAKGFAANGARVMVHYNASKAEAGAVVAEIIAAGGEAALVQGDISDRSVPARIVADTVKHFGRIDVLINNAGGMLGRKWLGEMDDAHYDRVMDLNVWSVVAFMREVAPLMKAQGGGNIINVSSIAARHGGGGGSVAAAAAAVSAPAMALVMAAHTAAGMAACRPTSMSAAATAITIPITARAIKAAP